MCVHHIFPGWSATWVYPVLTSSLKEGLRVRVFNSEQRLLRRDVTKTCNNYSSKTAGAKLLSVKPLMKMVVLYFL